jgi:cyanophycin synthetase
MKISAARREELTQTLEPHCSPDLVRLTDAEGFLGPNPHANVPALIFSIETSAQLPPIRRIEAQLHASFPQHFAKPDGKATAARCDAGAIADLTGRLAVGLLRERLSIELRSGWRAEDATQATCWIEYLPDSAVLQGLGAALASIGAMLTDESKAAAAVQEIVGRIEPFCARCRPNNESSVLIAAARRKNLPYLQIAQDSALWQFGWGKRSEQFWTTASDQDGLFAQHVSVDKSITKRLCLQLGLPTPAWRLLRREDDFRSAARAIGWPCVVKPHASGGGAGVSADIRDLETLERAVAVARNLSPRILIEAHEPGDNFRLMVVDGQLVLAVRLDPPEVAGDGARSVGELVAALNQERRHRRTYLKPVLEDDVFLTALASQGVGIDTILPKGETVKLRTNSNQSTGGSFANVLDRVHPQVRQLAEHLAAATGFRTVGIDYVTPDISRSHDEVGGGIIEINTTAGLEVIISSGVVPETMAEITVGEFPARIPVRLLVAPRDAQRVIEPALRAQLGDGAAVATAASAWIGSLPLPANKLDPFARAQALLRYPSVEQLWIMWSDEEVCSFGIPVDRLAEALIVGGGLDGRWREVLRRQSDRLTDVATPDEAIARILESAA